MNKHKKRQVKVDKRNDKKKIKKHVPLKKRYMVRHVPAGVLIEARSERHAIHLYHEAGFCDRTGDTLCPEWLVNELSDEEWNEHRALSKVDQRRRSEVQSEGHR